jgi:uncharacterized protein with ParB-like and HNH nuclease domain
MSKTLERLDITLDGIGHALLDRNLVVPVYQRSYAWEEKQVRELLQDVFTSIKNAEKEYFIGSIVISSNDNVNEVVDGQQRLATVSIIIAAIRDYFATNDDRERASDIQGKYLALRNIRTQEITPKLRLNGSDHDFYYNTIISFPNTKETSNKESHRRLANAYQIAKKFVRDYASTLNNASDGLMDILDFLEKQLRVIIVQVPSHANAFNIFETLNDRGLELAISDLLKNYLFGKSGDRLNEIQVHWTEMFSILENADNASLVVTFIRHYWSSIYGLTRERVLYDEIKKRITSKQRAVDLSKNLASNARVYNALLDPSHSFWQDFSMETRNNVSYLNLFGMVQVRPLLLAILGKFKKSDTEKAIKFLVASSVRFLIHGGLGGGALETAYSERAKDINDGNITTTKLLVDKMKSVIPSDAEFEDSFKVASVSKQSLARHYLIILEQFSNGATKPELIPNTDTTAVNLEHILPKAPDRKAWNFEPEKVWALHNRLGNLTLLSTKINSEVGNSSFDVKKKVYEKSEFNLTKNLKRFKSWGEKEINQRQEEMAKLAIKAWSLK